MATKQLPQDILIKIFLYLPFESIKACKLVSKQWKNLIDDSKYRPSVAAFHIQNSVYCVSITNPIKIGSHCNPPLTVNRIPIEWKDDDERITELLSESSKGFACVVTNHCRILFSNLFTGASFPPTELPPSSGNLPAGVDAYLLYGFGYDSFANDWKMMLVKDFSTLFWVYSLRNRAWKSFEGFPCATRYQIDWDQSRACSFNGVLHWLVNKTAPRSYTKSVSVILTYDLHTCRFGEMLLPCGYGWRYRTNIAEIGRRLCYCCRSRSRRDQSLRVWAMIEYGVSESWTSSLSIDLTVLGDRSRDEIELTRVLYKFQSGSNLFLFVCKKSGTLYWYDIDNHKVTSIRKNTWEKGMNRKRKRQELEGV